MSERQRDAIAVASLVALKAGAMLYALHCGFQQVSDDDYARTVIAQLFVHQPKLDPSGTSWLPFPFWLYGGIMLLLGRSLVVARCIAFLLGALAPTLVYFGLRAMSIQRLGAIFGTIVGAVTPWSVWLALAPVPEGWAGCCGAAALLFLASGSFTTAGALALVASLSRYESWPVAGLVVGVCVIRRHQSRRTLFGGLLALAGPLFWLANNAMAHQDALHFLTRVAAFHRATVGAMTVGARLAEYPVALLRHAPDVVAVLTLGLLFAHASLERWVMPLVGAALVFAFLIYGALRDGAPTHHAVRALMVVIILLGAFGGVRAACARRSIQLGIAAAWFGCLVWRAAEIPGRNAGESRTAQLARGRELAASVSIEVTPCAYEHFALIAAYGAPERVTVRAALPQQQGDCPAVIAR